MLKTLLSIVFIAATLLCTGCKDDCDWLSIAEDEANIASAAEQTWNSDPANTTNCIAYKNALQDYLDALDDARPCADEDGNLIGWQTVVDLTEEKFNNLTC